MLRDAEYLHHLGGTSFCHRIKNTDEPPDNLDADLAVFLKKWFPDEVKAKQRYNEHMAGIDQYGEVYADQKCVVM